MNIIEGKNVKLRGKLDGDMVYFACATGVDFYHDTEMVEKATVGMAGWKGYTYGLSEWGFSLTSLSVIVPTTTMLTVFHTLLESLRKNGIDMELIFEDPDGNLKTITGRCLIPHTGISAQRTGFSQDTIEFKGDGAFEIATSLIAPSPAINTNVQVINYTSASGSETTLTYPETIGMDIISFARDGIGKEVITVGSPNDKQVKWASGTGVFTLPYDTGVGEWIYIEYQ